MPEPVSRLSRPAEAAGEAPPPGPPKKSLELQLGTYWLVRVGIVMLVTGLVFFGTYAYKNFIGKIGPWGKVSLLYAAGGALLGTGIWLHRKEEKLRNYAQVLVAGGMAAVYFTTYGAHHIPQLLVIQSAFWDGLLLLAWAGFVVWFADRHKSEVLALFAVLLAYYSSVITRVEYFTLYSNLLLTAAAVFFLVRNRWATLSFASLVATYFSYAYWRFFHDGEWHWATPGEGLWTGIYFLAAYWALFTGAVFLSRHEQFSGERRATFLSLNNGAFFAGFVLTMLQTHQGGFWKFCLVYGAVLLILTVLARRFLADDSLFGNAYLTQGVLLATLGLITYYEGLHLSLVLAAESVVLVTVGREMKSGVLNIASVLAAALAAARCLITTTTEPVGHHELIIGCSVGAMILFNAFWLRKETDYDRSISHFRTVAYSTLALAVWLVVVWRDALADWRGLELAAVCVALLCAARPLGNQILSLGAYIFAAAGAGWETFHLGNHFTFHDVHPETGLLQACTLGTLMVFAAFWERRRIPQGETVTFDLSALFYSAGGLLVWAAATCAFAPAKYLGPLLGLETIAFTAAYYFLRLPEITVLGQFFLLFAQLLWLEQAANNELRPWWNAASLIVITLTQAAWWQRQKTLVFRQPVGLAFQGAAALAAVGLLFYWLHPQFNAPAWLAFASVLAIALTVYATLNRFWLLALTGQFFTVVSVFEFCRQLADSEPVWYLPLVPIAGLCALSFGTIQWFARHQQAAATIREPILQVATVYRVVALAMSIWWVDKYVPARENCWALALVGVVLFAAAGWWRNQELLVFSAVYTLVATARFWIEFRGAPSVYLPNLPALLALLIQQQVAARMADRYRVPRGAHIGAIVLGGLSLWLLLTRWISESASGFYLTAGWSVLALALFVTGMMLRERIYRWLGLGILACALGRVALFDVWKLETLYRILSFMALGIVLLVLGYIYTKYQEKIKEWL